MPKGKTAIGNTRKMRSVRTKFKLGNRKSTVSALSLSTDELLDKFETPSYKKDRKNIGRVLVMRGIKDIPAAIAARKVDEPTEEAA